MEDHEGQPETELATDPRERLREATRSEHERTERAIADRFFGPEGLDRQRFGDLLLAFLGLYRPLDERLEPAVRRHLGPDYAYRPRSPRLGHDLRVLGRGDALDEVSTSSLDELPPLDRESRLLGVLYVIEGSELGARVIWKHLEERLGPKALRADAFFGRPAEQTREAWSRFTDLLARRLPASGPEFREAMTAADATFGAFRCWLS